MSPEEEMGYYYGFANEGLWPLCHIAHTRPVFRAPDWEHYQNVNRRFADVVRDEARTDDPIVLVQDYHFALLPRMIRERLPRATIIMPVSNFTSSARTMPARSSRSASARTSGSGTSQTSVNAWSTAGS